MRITIKNNNSDFAMYFAAKLGPALLGFLNVYLIAKSLTPENYGKYSLAITLILLVNQVFGSWLTQALFFFLPKCAGQATGMASWFGQINFLVAVVGSLIVTGLLPLFEIDVKMAFVGGAVFFAQTYWNYLSTLYQSLERPRIQLIATICQVSLQILVIFSLYFFNAISASSALFTVFIGFAAGLVFFQKKSESGRATVDFSGIQTKNFLRYTKLAFFYGGPFSLWFLFSQIFTYSDRFLLSWAGLAHEVGKYSATRDLLLGSASIFAMPLLMVAHPMIMRVWAERKDAAEIGQIIQNNLTKIFVVGTFFCLMLYLYGAPTLSMFLPAKYQLQNYEYAMIGAAIFFSVASMYAHKALEVTGGTMKMAALGGGVALFSLLANAVVIRGFGLTAVILIGLLSQMIYYFGAAYLSRKLWKVHVSMKRIITTILAAAVVWTICWLIDFNYPHSISTMLPLPWGLLAGVIISLMAILSFPEINSMFYSRTTATGIGSDCREGL
ncbi:lipopolysaccharide biosynthesis protein [Pseudoduganella ginsengisoli]|uniref:Oligosaccharide flippase family protein n=1 Tax=Pseudoduganella ginsengisoli TaxID=1462440 RepID=A0A6L6PU22_9BURK|nr:lipopolysaccharide biosynthesis protein [Pseudoduganella ginsengisoli]MTW00518.1 oligosaccharide flippase family protein [Pseudoduganella ginsengisoli]